MERRTDVIMRILRFANTQVSERNAKMGETYARERTQARTHTHGDMKAKAPMHLCVSLTERTDSVGHLKGGSIYEYLRFLAELYGWLIHRESDQLS